MGRMRGTERIGCPGIPGGSRIRALGGCLVIRVAFDGMEAVEMDIKEAIPKWSRNYASAGQLASVNQLRRHPQVRTKKLVLAISAALLAGSSAEDLAVCR